MKKNKDALTDHLNSMDPTGSIKFTDEPETDGNILYFDALIFRKEDGSVKIKVYQKKMHTDQYLHFNSHNLLNHKLGVFRTLYNQFNNIVNDPADVVIEITVNQALTKCEYSEWLFKKVKQQLNQKAAELGKNKTTKKDQPAKRPPSPTHPCVKGLSEV